MHEQAHLLQVLEVELLGGVIQVDRLIGRGEFSIGLEGFAHAGEVAGELVGEHLLIGRHVVVELLDLGDQSLFHGLELRIGLAQVPTLFDQDGVVGSFVLVAGGRRLVARGAGQVRLCWVGEHDVSLEFVGCASADGARETPPP